MRKFSLSQHSRKSHVNDEGIDGFDWNEAQPKWPAVRILNTTLGVLSIIVWIILLFRLFASGNAKFEKMILLDDNAQKSYPAEEQVLRIHSNTDEEGKSGLVVYYPVYLEKAENFQLTAKINRRVLKPGKGDLGYTFILRESGGEETKFYPLSYENSQRKFNYTFFRLCFNGVKLDQKKVYTLLVYCGEKDAESGEYSAKDADFSFTLLNSDTYCNMITPDKDVFVED